MKLQLVLLKLQTKLDKAYWLLVQNEGLLSAQVLDDILSINNMVKPKMSAYSE